MYLRSLIRSTAYRIRFSPNIYVAEQARQFTMSSTVFSDGPTDPEQPSNTAKKEPLALPEVPYNPTTQIDMSNGSKTIKLDHLGPMVVNVDGSLGRITNWAGMTDMEKESTLKLLGKRNQARLAVLRAKKGAEGTKE